MTDETRLLPSVNTRCLLRQKDGDYLEVVLLEVSPTAAHVKLLRPGPKGSSKVEEWTSTKIFWDLFQEELGAAPPSGILSALTTEKSARSPREKEIFEEIGFGEDR